MNGHTENKKNTYAHLDRLSTEALEELLCADIKSPDDDDDEVVLHILEVIEQREKAIPTGRLSDVDKALEEFQTYYNIPEMNGVTLYPEETAESVTDAVTMVGFIPKRPWIRVLGTIAATVIFMFAMLLWRLGVAAMHAKDLAGALICCGIMGHLALQVILNIAVVTNTIPNTGITLPFISYGGTSAVFLLGEMGLAMNVGKCDRIN